MAGSQLKLLKASLKSAGLTGQTNVKKKGKKSKAPSDTRRDDKQKVVEKIREEFNPLEVKTNRVKRDVTELRKSKQVVGKPGISKQIGEEQRKKVYEEMKRTKNRVGGVIDRRFGENNPHLNPEEKMLERFTRERQISSKKSSAFNLEDSDGDDGDYGGMQLTHYGQSLSLDDEETVADNKHSYSDDDEGAESQPARKKTKAEVMKEVIAKSKFYKHQRQQEQQRNENVIHELDEEFDDVMQELQSIKLPKKPIIVPKSEVDIAYDAKIKELAFDRRSVPADRTKTTEELETERNEAMRKLEQDRLRRMQGLDPENDKDRAATGDDLDDDFWGGEGSEDEAQGFAIKDSDEATSDEDSDEDEDSGSEEHPRKRSSNGEVVIKIGNKVINSSSKVSSSHIPCPTSEEELAELLSAHEFTETNNVVRKILNTYQPRLALGNKEKMAHFSGVLLNHILTLADTQDKYKEEEFVKVIEELIVQLRQMTEKYNETLFQTFKAKIVSIQEDISESYGDYEPKTSDLVFYSIVGSFYSTSDLYHLIVTPTLILITETLAVLKIQHSFSKLMKGVFLTELLFQYQRLSKRYIPELTSFIEKAFLCLIPEIQKLDVAKSLTLTSKKFKSSFAMQLNEKLDESSKSEPIKLSILNQDLSEPSLGLKSQVVFKLLKTLDLFQSLYKSESAFVEIMTPFIAILKHLVKYQASVPEISDLLSRTIKLVGNSTHRPLKLQDHRPVAILSNVPKFEENFNPMKKSYDFDPQRQEVNKLKAQLKKERKLTLKDIRKDSKFEAREQIREKKQLYSEYHNKMSKIVNSISTVEGAEKNEYEREKKLRKNKK